MDLTPLSMFESSSANNHENKNLWIKGASLYIGQLNTLIDNHLLHEFVHHNANEFINTNQEELGNLFTKYKSDKSDSFHNYHIVYSYVIDQLKRDSKLNVLEIGLGTNNINIVSNMGAHGVPGASLFSFREYLPNSMIYGADIDKDILFESERIKTFYVDQLEYDTFQELSKNKYDLIIDDGLHSIGANFNTLLFALNNLNDGGWVVIEDIFYPSNWKAIDFILTSSKKYKTYMIQSPTSHVFMYIVNKL